jgi:N-acetylglucosamine malate deacetylase 1
MLFLFRRPLVNCIASNSKYDIMKKLILFLQVAFLATAMIQAQQAAGHKLHVIIIGAHPDDPDEVGGTAYKWAQLGYDVEMVALTNGDAGHQSIKATELAKIRREEARKAGLVIGVKYITLDNHDGQLMPTYENRLQVIRLIREWKADIVIYPRPYDYHPDHRYTGVLVNDAAYMVTVPTILPEVPFLEKNPVFLYTYDHFTHPEPFKADVVIDIDDAIEKKLDMYHQHTSQMYEWLPFNQGILDQVPSGDAARREWLGKMRKHEWDAEPFRAKLIEEYGPEKGKQIKYCEAFQDSEYGTRLTKENMTYYFPFLTNDKK